MIPLRMSLFRPKFNSGLQNPFRRKRRSRYGLYDLKFVSPFKYRTTEQKRAGRNVNNNTKRINPTVLAVRFSLSTMARIWRTCSGGFFLKNIPR